jgi:hypothetical protein
MRLLDRLGRQPMVIVAGWIVAAILAVLVGIVGIGVVGAGLTSRQGAPVSQDDVIRALGESSSPTPEISEKSGEPSAGSPEAQAKQTRGGTVLISCERIISMAPAQGFQVHEQSENEGEFRGISDNHDRVKVELTCTNGQPDLRIRDEGDD